MGYEAVRFPFEGAVDADGHVLEPATLWEDYLEQRFRPRALRIKRDDNGLEYLEIGGRPSERIAKGVLGIFGAMGDPDAKPGPDRLYMDHIPYGGGDPKERIELLDRENLQRTFLYPTLGLLWECELDDPELTAAYQRAYNRWIADFCRDSGGRLVPIAHLSLLDVDAAVEELERAVEDGCRGAFIAPFTVSRKPHGHRDHDALWAKACELDVPVAIHPTYEPLAVRPTRFSFDGWSGPAVWYLNVLARQSVQQAFLTFFALGTLERFERLKLGVLESGAGWIGSFLDRMDTVYATEGSALELTAPPSVYFRRQCFISCDPDETAVTPIIDHVGADRFMWATDYPHPDHPSTWVSALEELVRPLRDEARQAVLGENVDRIYGFA